MTRRRTIIGAGALSLVVLAATVLLPAIAAGVPANQVPVTQQAAAEDLSEPTGDAWADLEAREIPLTSAPSGLPGANVVSTNAVGVKTAVADERLYVWLQWEDRTLNDSEDSLQAFTDGAAVQLPANVSTSPAVGLGSTDTPVNLWYWTAAEGPEEALAGGYNPGSITELNDTTVATDAVHEGGTWTVVMERPLEATGEARADVDPNADLDLAFAVWNGANAERSGHHAYSEWYTVPLGPDAAGPNAQYLLWAIVGIGIAVALVFAVRGRGGGQ
jgi:complex iron-sulfur molybdoenzyme family reductase subunit gamma